MPPRGSASSGVGGAVDSKMGQKRLLKEYKQLQAELAKCPMVAVSSSSTSNSDSNPTAGSSSSSSSSRPARPSAVIKLPKDPNGIYAHPSMAAGRKKKKI